MESMPSAHHMCSARTGSQREDAEDKHSGIPDRGSTPSPAAGFAGRGNGFGRIGGLSADSRLLDGASGACDPCHRFSASPAAPAADDREIRKLAPPALAEARRTLRLWQPAPGEALLSSLKGSKDSAAKAFGVKARIVILLGGRTVGDEPVWQHESAKTCSG